MRIGCCAGLDKMQIVQDAEYDYIELPFPVLRAESPDSEFELVRQYISGFDIKPEAWNCLLAPDMKIVGPDVDTYRIERYLRTSLERIEKVGGEIVVFGSGAARRIPEGFPSDEARDQMMEFLRLAGRIAGSHGITIALEPLNSAETNNVNTVADGIDLVRSVDHPFVKLIVDVYHVSAEGEPLENLLEPGPDIVHVHLADTGRRYPGCGCYPFNRLFDILGQIGYGGGVSVECNFGDFEAECVAACGFLRSQATAAGL